MHNHHNHHKIQQLFDQPESLEFPTNLAQDIEIWNDVCKFNGTIEKRSLILPSSLKYQYKSFLQIGQLQWDRGSKKVDLLSQKAYLLK